MVRRRWWATALSIAVVVVGAATLSGTSNGVQDAPPASPPPAAGASAPGERADPVRVEVCGSAAAGSSGPVRSSMSAQVGPLRVDLDPELVRGALAQTGTPWCPASASQPGFANTLVPGDPVVDEAETAVLRSLSGVILNIEEYTEPVYYREPTAGLRPVRCVSYGCVGGDRAPVTGDEVVASGGDGQLVVVDLVARRSYEFWQVRTDADGTVALGPDGEVVAGSMAVVDIDGRGNATAEGERLNITGAGVSRLFGVIRAHEVRAAQSDPRTAIPHALQVAIPPRLNCSDSFREPATKTDGRASSWEPCIEQGARFQLSPDVDCTAVATPMGEAVCWALQTHGGYNIDNGSNRHVVVYGQHVGSWSTAAEDYRAVGIEGDYSDLGLPVDRFRVLASWDGR